MAEDDLYLQWLKIPPGPRPPDHYALLGIARDYTNVEEIEAAAHARLEILDKYALHPKVSRREACQEMMNAVARARIVLTNSEKRAAYDKTLAPFNSSQQSSAPARSLSQTGQAPASSAAKTTESRAKKSASRTSQGASGLLGWINPNKNLSWKVSVPVLALALAVGAVVVVKTRQRAPELGNGAFAEHERSRIASRTPTWLDPPPKNVAPVKVPPVAGSASPPKVDPFVPGKGVTPAPPERRVPVAPPSVVRTDPPRRTPPAPVVRRAVPSIADQDSAKKLVNEVFGDTLAGATTAAERIGIARKMISTAADTPENPAARYVLYSQAGTLAAGAGDISTAFSAIDAASTQFQMDWLRVKAQTLDLVAKLPGTSPDAGDFTTKCNAVIDDALATDRYDIALQSATLGLSAARKSHDEPGAEKLQGRLQEIGRIETDFQKSIAANAALQKNPSDSAANNLLGRFRCFVKEDWVGGLPMLAKSDNAAVRAAALAELAHPADAQKQIEVGDAWWDLSQNEPSYLQGHIRHHAAGIYAGIAAQVTGLRRVLLNKRMEEAGVPLGHVVDLMQFIDVSKDAVVGKWEMSPDGLTVEAGQSRILRLRYCPPPEYDLRIEFNAIDRHVSLEEYLTHEGHLFGWVQGREGFLGFKCQYTFDAFDRKVPNLSTTEGPILERGATFVSIVKVRADRVTALMNGQVLADISTDYSNLQTRTVQHHPEHIENGLGLTAAEGPIHFTKIELIEITGTGHPIPHRDDGG